MVFIYRGKSAKLTAEVAELGDVISKRYREILGNDRADRLTKIGNMVLTPDVFFDTLEQLEPYGGTPQTKASKFVMVADVDTSLYPTGRMKANRAQLGVGFYVSDESFEHSGSRAFTDRPIATYVHEFDHFALLALQRTPLYLAEMVMDANVNAGQISRPEQVADLIARLNITDMKPARRLEIVGMATAAYAMHDTWECATRVLDKLVLSSVGITPDLSWRHTPRKYGMVELYSPHKIVAIPISGDPYAGLSDEQVIERTLDWQNNLNLLMKLPFLDNIHESLKTLKVDLQPITNFRDRLRGDKQ